MTPAHRYLSLGRNSFTGTIPAALSLLTQLQVLSISHLPLLTAGVFPTAISTLTALTYANTTSHTLHSGPTHTGARQQAVPLLPGYLSSCMLCDGACRWLDVTACSRTGTIPSFIGTLTNLQILGLYSAAFVGPPPQSFSSLRSLT